MNRDETNDPRFLPQKSDVIHFEELSKGNAQWEPFSATIHMPDGKPLALIEKSMVGEALVNIAHRICERRGLEPGAPFWEE